VACSTDANPASVLPRTFDLGTADLVCDVKDRVIVVSAKQVTVRTRPLLTPVRAPIERTGHLGDRCDGPGGGHAGCSITYWRFSSKVLGSGHLEFGNNAGNVLHDDDPDKAMDCREYSSFEVIATCSTAKHFVLVKYQDDAAGRGSCWHLHARLWDAGDQVTELDGDVDRAASGGDRWVFRFPAADSAVTLRFARRPGSATLEIGGERERCAVFRLSSRRRTTRIDSPCQLRAWARFAALDGTASGRWERRRMRRRPRVGCERAGPSFVVGDPGMTWCRPPRVGCECTSRMTIARR